MGFSFNRQSLTSRGSGTITAVPVGSLVVDKTEILLAVFAGDASQTFTDPEETFTLSNGGPGNWDNPQYGIAYSDATGWLSFVPVPGVDGIYFAPVVDATALTESTQIATLTFTDGRVSNSGAVTVTITLFVGVVAPRLQLSTNALTFSMVNGTAPGTAQTVTASNGSASGSLATPTIGALTGTGTAYIDDVSVLVNGDGTFGIQVTPTADGGTPGTYSVAIPVSSSGATGSPQTITATITVTAAQQALIVMDRTLDDGSAEVGGASPASASVGVRSGNSVPLAGPTATVVGYVGAHSGWLSASITGGLLTATPNTQSIQSSGVTDAQVDVVDQNAANTQRYVFRLNIGSAPALPSIVLSPSGVSQTIVVGSDAPDVAVTVSATTGGLPALGTVTAAFTTAIAWCAAPYSNGVITLTFVTAGESEGTLSATLRISASGAGNSPYDMPIEVVITGTPGAYPNIPWTLPSGASHDTGTDEVAFDPFTSPADASGFA